MKSGCMHFFYILTIVITKNTKCSRNQYFTILKKVKLYKSNNFCVNKSVSFIPLTKDFHLYELEIDYNSSLALKNSIKIK